MKVLLIVVFLLIPAIACGQLVCKDGDFYHDGFCYNVPTFAHKNGMSHSSAQAYCRQKGENLPAFHNAEQEGFVVLMAIRLFGKGYNWIGLSNGKWDDGSVVDYTNWGEGYPTHNSSCVIEYFNNKKNNEGSWRDDYDCDIKAKFLCQYSSGSATVLPTTVPLSVTTKLPTTRGARTASTTSMKPHNVSRSCQNADFVYRKRCYFFPYHQETYYTAKSNCELKNQTLAILDDFEYAEAVSNYAETYLPGRYYRIGLHFDSTVSNYTWADGTPLTYTTWAADAHPKNQVPSVLLYIYETTWYTEIDNVTYSYICSGVL